MPLNPGYVLFSFMLYQILLNFSTLKPFFFQDYAPCYANGDFIGRKPSRLWSFILLSQKKYFNPTFTYMILSVAFLIRAQTQLVINFY